MGQQGAGPSVSEIAARLRENARELCRTLLPNGVEAGGFWNVGSVRGESGDSLKVKLNGPKQGTWADYACAESDPEGMGDMLKLVQLTVSNGDIGAAVRWAKGWLGIESMDPKALDRMRERANKAQCRKQQEQARDDEKRRRIAAGLWHGSAPILATPAQAYLEGRGIDFAVIGKLPGACRFRHDVNHAEKGKPLPALLTCGVGLDGQHRVTHATFLHREVDGRWVKLPPVDVVDRVTGEVKQVLASKKIFGPGLGHHFPINKGASKKPLRDMPKGEWLYVSEGLEDALTFAMLHPDRRVVMAGTLGNIGEMELPRQCGQLVILAQRDHKPKAIKALEKAMLAQQQRAKADGSSRKVMCLWPGEHFKDLNDELLGKRMQHEARG